MATLELTLEEEVQAQPARRGRRLGLLFWAAIGWIVLVFAVAIFADLLPLPSPTDMDMLARRAAFSAAHWLGTDGLGRAMGRTAQSPPRPAPRHGEPDAGCDRHLLRRQPARLCPHR